MKCIKGYLGCVHTQGDDQSYAARHRGHFIEIEDKIFPKSSAQEKPHIHIVW